MPGLGDIFRRVTRRSRREPDDVSEPSFVPESFTPPDADADIAPEPPLLNPPAAAEPPPQPETAPLSPPPPPVPEYALVGEPAGPVASEPASPIASQPAEAAVAEPAPAPSAAPDHSSLADDDALGEDYLMLECPYCGLTEQRVGARCEKCGQVIVRLPTWAQHRRRNWLLERLSWRRIITASAIVIFALFIVWINYPFAPNPVILFKNIQTQMTADEGPGVWSISGRDTRNTRAVSVGFDPPVGTIVWNTQIPEPLGSEPVAQYSNVYLGSANGIYPLSNSGEIREGWQGDTPGRITAAAGVVDTYLFFGSTDHTVNAWDALTGDTYWTFTAEDTVEVAPVIVNGLVYISSGKGWLYALDAHSGSLIWRTQLDSNASGAVAVYDARLVVGDEGGVFYVLSARTGQEWFRFRTAKAIRGAPVISADGRSAFFASTGRLYAVSADRREIPGLFQFKQIWAQLWFWQVPGVPRPQGQQGGLWQFSPENPLQGIYSSPALADDSGTETLYVGGHDRVMYALNAANGSVLWTFQAENAILTSPLIVKDRLIFGDASGYLYSLSRDDGALDWQIFMGSGISIPPIISNELLIVRTVAGDIFGIK